MKKNKTTKKGGRFKSKREKEGQDDIYDEIAKKENMFFRTKYNQIYKYKNT